MSSVAYAPHVAQSPNFRPPGIPECYWITLCFLRSRCQGDPTAVSAREIGGYYARTTGKPIKDPRLLGERHKRWLRENGHLESTPGFFNRMRVLFTPAPKKPPNQAHSNDTGHDTGRAKPFKFSSFSDPESSNKESKESPSPSPISPKRKDGVWADLITWVKERTGQLLADWQVGLIARDGKRAGITLSALLASLINGRHKLESARNVFALLLSIARRAGSRPDYQHKAKETGQRRPPCEQCKGSQVLKIDGHWTFCSCRGTA